MDDNGEQFRRGFPRSLPSAVLRGDLMVRPETELSSRNWNNTLIINPICNRKTIYASLWWLDQKPQITLSFTVANVHYNGQSIPTAR